jgi:hypothetical protein
MRRLYAFWLVFGLTLLAAPVASAQQFAWAKLIRNITPSTNLSYTTVAATDTAGNTYVSVGFQDSINVQGQVLHSSLAGTTVLAKYNSAGKLSWMKTLNGFQVNAIKAGPSGLGPVLLGEFVNPTRTWNGVAVTAPGPHFLAQSAPDGSLAWINSLPALSPAALTVDGLGNSYVLGGGQAGTMIGSSLLNDSTLVLVQHSPTGTLQWLNHLYGVERGGIRFCGPRGLNNISLGPKPGGGCLVLGNFHRLVYFGITANAPSLSLPTTANTNGLIANYSVSGTLLWNRAVTGDWPALRATGADAAGNCYVAGGANAAMTFGPGLSTTGGIAVAKYDAQGTPLWVRGQRPSPGQQYNEKAYFLAVDNNGVTVLTDAAVQPGQPSTIIGTQVLRSYLCNFVRFDALGNALWTAGETWPGWTGNLQLGVVLQGTITGCDKRGNVYAACFPFSTPRTGAINSNLGVHTTVGDGVIITKIGTAHNTISGRVYIDQNANGQLDSNEGAFPLALVSQAQGANATVFGTTESAGQYKVFADSGAYTLSIPQLPRYYSITQPSPSASYTGRFRGYGNTDSLRHFGLRPVANQADVRITLTPYGAVRPGFLTRYRLTLENVGTTTVASGTATLTLDSHVTYVSSTPSGSRTGQTVTWSYTSLAPFAQRDFDVMFSLPVNVALGTLVTFTAQAPLPGDVNPADNVAGTETRVTGSYDPNDIAVNYSQLTPAQVAAGQSLDYTIRFQNMGTDTAFTVIVKDTLNFQKLNLGTLQLIAQSHNCMWSLTGQGELTVRFLNAKLPYRNVDVIRSQGFVRFRVQPRTSLRPGDLITNRAAIVFDYNAPVRTNTATTLVATPTAMLASHNAATWDAYPNPVSEDLTLAADLPQAGIIRIELYDALGRPVHQQTQAAPAGPLRQVLHLRGLAPGLYVLRLTLPDGSATSRTVVHE